MKKRCAEVRGNESIRLSYVCLICIYVYAFLKSGTNNNVVGSKMVGRYEIRPITEAALRNIRLLTQLVWSDSTVQVNLK